MNDFQQTFNLLRTKLTTAQTERLDRQDVASNGEPEWVAYEQGVMLAAVNEIREAGGQQAVTLQQIERAETSAVGHVDYTKKFALYCAELALGVVR